MKHAGAIIMCLYSEVPQFASNAIGSNRMNRYDRKVNTKFLFVIYRTRFAMIQAAKVHKSDRETARGSCNIHVIFKKTG